MKATFLSRQIMGITALGTLQVLLPTVAGRPDPTAAQCLTRDLKWSAGGACLIALGAVWLAPLALVGAAAYAWPLARLMAHAWRAWRHEIVAPGNAMPLLAAAMAGLALALGHGMLHAFGMAAGAHDIPLFIVAFLLPLVSGAAGQLLPVWLRPGVQEAWHRQSRQRLAWGARGRGALLVAGGVLTALGYALGYGLALLCALWLALAMLAVLFRAR